MKRLETIEAVRDELGGNRGVAALTGAKPKTVSMWRNLGVFPSKNYVAMIGALHQRGFDAPPTLWGMTEAVE